MHWLTSSLFVSLAANVQAVNCLDQISPSIVVVTFYGDERDSFLSHQDQFSFYSHNITMPGASPQFPDLHCIGDYSVCLMTTGEGELNAANSITALWNTPGLNLTETYIITGGIAGGNPKVVPTNSVIFNRFLVQPSMQYEIDIREAPANFSTGYFPQGGYSPNDTWGYVYNTEVFAINSDLRDLAASMAGYVQLKDSDDAKAYRAKYASDPAYTAGTQAPSVVKCDTATSDNWFSGAMIADAMDERMKLWTNGSAVYCATAQEDGAVMAAFLRGALAKKVDFNRIISFRTISDVDRPYPGQSVLQNLVYSDPGSYDTSIENLYIAGSAVINGILEHWIEDFKPGIRSTAYTGDLWGSLGGTPNFGPGRTTEGSPVDLPGALGGPAKKRALRRRQRL